MITCAFENGKTARLRHVVVHAIVEQEGKLLLVKRSPKISEGGKWSLPSGFLDRDETASQAVLRELIEETGWEGEVMTLFFIKTDPNRPHEDRQNVSFHFLVRATGRIGKGDWESTDVAWVPIDTLPLLDTLAFDHGEAIAHYLRFRKKAFPLPLIVQHRPDLWVRAIVGVPKIPMPGSRISTRFRALLEDRLPGRKEHIFSMKGCWDFDSVKNNGRNFTTRYVRHR